jgi:NADH dehydrogenase FAD-containing subunit
MLRPPRHRPRWSILPLNSYLAKTHAIPFRSLEDAYRLRDRLKTLEQSDRDKIRVAIIGGGYSGVELACKLADSPRRKGKNSSDRKK